MPAMIVRRYSIEVAIIVEISAQARIAFDIRINRIHLDMLHLRRSSFTPPRIMISTLVAYPQSVAHQILLRAWQYREYKSCNTKNGAASTRSRLPFDKWREREERRASIEWSYLRARATLQLLSKSTWYCKWRFKKTCAHVWFLIFSINDGLKKLLQ